MRKLRPVATKREPTYPSRRAVRGSRRRGAAARALAVASASAALFLAGCGGCDGPADEVRLPGQAPIAAPDPQKPDKPDSPWFSWIPELKPDLPPAEPIRLAGIAREPFVD